VNDQQVARLELVEASCCPHAPARLVHERERLEHQRSLSGQLAPGGSPEESRAPRTSAATRQQAFDHHEADVVAGIGVALAII
jgi:hypothetical protein